MPIDILDMSVRKNSPHKKNVYDIVLSSSPLKFPVRLDTDDLEYRKDVYRYWFNKSVKNSSRVINYINNLLSIYRMCGELRLFVDHVDEKGGTYAEIVRDYLVHEIIAKQKGE